MLVLTRKNDESIKIGDDVRVTVIRSTNGAVRLGIEAPADVPIVREKFHRPETGANQLEPRAA